jgi:hypothetical protein
MTASRRRMTWLASSLGPAATQCSSTWPARQLHRCPEGGYAAEPRATTMILREPGHP